MNSLRNVNKSSQHSEKMMLHRVSTVNVLLSINEEESEKERARPRQRNDDVRREAYS